MRRVRQCLLFGGIQVAEFKYLRQPTKRFVGSASCYSRRWEWESVTPGLHNGIPVPVSLEQHSTESDGPPQYVVTLG